MRGVLNELHMFRPLPSRAACFILQNLRTPSFTHRAVSLKRIPPRSLFSTLSHIGPGDIAAIRIRCSYNRVKFQFSRRDENAT
jgi:hypothetical protein